MGVLFAFGYFACHSELPVPVILSETKNLTPVSIEGAAKHFPLKEKGER
jgi:hypothetical protein